MFLLAAGAGLIVGFGLLRLKNLARRAAIVIALAGMVMLVPKVSAAATDLSPQFFVAGSMIVVRMMIVWYLWQNWTAEKFR
jgi:xanthosine utilization system XapX-like protein